MSNNFTYPNRHHELRSFALAMWSRHLVTPEYAVRNAIRLQEELDVLCKNSGHDWRPWYNPGPDPRRQKAEEICYGCGKTREKPDEQS